MARPDSRVFRGSPKVWFRSADWWGTVGHFYQNFAVDRERLISVQFFSALVAFWS
jgi:hypothetical protein